MIQPNEINAAKIAGKLLAYLRDELNDSSIEYDVPLTQLQGGFETVTYQFQLKGAQKELNQCLVLRLYPEYIAPEEVVWDSSVQNTLADTGYPVARTYLTCNDISILGGAFFIMDFLPGKPMMTAPIETVPNMLADIHVALHSIDPGPLIKSLNEQGFDENRYLFNTMFDAVAKLPKKLSWIRDTAEWMVDNRPPEPGRLAICHGDFHPNNILIQDGQVTGVLDWHLTIADPAYDIAYSIQVITVHTKAVMPNSEWARYEMLSQRYQESYQEQIPLDSAKLNYYRVVNSLRTLIGGFLGNQHLSHPLIVKNLIEFINKVTGIQVTMPNLPTIL